MVTKVKLMFFYSSITYNFHILTKKYPKTLFIKSFGNSSTKMWQQEKSNLGDHWPQK